MKKPIRQAFQLLLSLLLLLTMAEGGFIGNYRANGHDQCHAESTECPIHFEHSHNHSPCDFIFICSAKVLVSAMLTNVDIIPMLHELVSDQYSPYIWQPPKFS